MAVHLYKVSFTKIGLKKTTIFFLLKIIIHCFCSWFEWISFPTFSRQRLQGQLTITSPPLLPPSQQYWESSLFSSSVTLRLPFFSHWPQAPSFPRWIVGANTNFLQQLAVHLDCGVVQFWRLTLGWVQRVSQTCSCSLKYYTGTVVCEQYFFLGIMLLYNCWNMCLYVWCTPVKIWHMKEFVPNVTLHINTFCSVLVQTAEEQYRENLRVSSSCMDIQCFMIFSMESKWCQ